ncbi:MAG: SH3 domain-containing protein [Calothrix sp. MO_167.B12]|nr:SH3 domain-containing protein [Calothrix sp. MO_167.B12]
MYTKCHCRYFTKANSDTLLNNSSEGQLVATDGAYESYYVCINSGYLNVRNGRGAIIGRVYKGQNLTVTANAGGRYQINYGRGYGWVSARYVCYGA